MLASRVPNLFNGNMESQASPASSSSRRGPAAQASHADWQPSSGIVDRMLAYRDWWNIPEGRGRLGAARNRTRPSEPAG